MRAIIPTFFVFAFSLAAYGEVQSASEFKQNCINTRIAHCLQGLPQTEPGQDSDPAQCTSGGVQTVFANACSDETTTYCEGYKAVVTEGVANTSDLKIPAGCPGAQAANVSPPKPSPPNHNIGSPDLAKAKADLQACTNMQSTAQKCCGDPQSCGGKSTTQDLQKLEDIVQDTQQDGDVDGLKQICSQAGSAADANVDLNSSYAGVCAAKHLSCSDACGQYWNKWNQVAASCTGSSCSQLSSVVAQMYSQQSSCTTLTASEQILQDKASQQAINKRIAQMCKDGVKADDKPPTDQVADTTTPSTSPTQRDPPTSSSVPIQNYPTQQTPTPPQQLASAPQAPPPIPLGSSECGTVGNIGSCVNCAEHPEYPSCGGAKNASSAPAQEALNESGSARSGSGAGSGIPNAGGMDVGSDGSHQGFQMADASATQNANGLASAAGLGMQPTASGGVFPPLDPKDISGSLLARAQMVAAKAGYKTDIFSGERGGGGYHTPAGANSGSGFERSGRSRGLAGGFAVASQALANGSYVGMDLKKYLPGGAYGPKRISGLGVAQSEIGPMSTDMFQRVSMRFKLICVQHGLIDCN